MCRLCFSVRVCDSIVVCVYFGVICVCVFLSQGVWCLCVHAYVVCFLCVDVYAFSVCVRVFYA